MKVYNCNNLSSTRWAPRVSLKAAMGARSNTGRVRLGNLYVIKGLLDGEQLHIMALSQREY